MKKPSDESQAPRKPKAVKKKRSLGRPLLPYFIPTLIIAIATMITIALVGQYLLQSAKQDISRTSMEQVIQSLAQGVSTVVAGARDSVRLLAADPRVERVIDGSDLEREVLADALAKSATGLLQVRILPQGWDRPLPNGVAPMGYAGVDMVRRTAGGESLPGEIHQLKTPDPYLAIVEPVVREGIVRGVIFAAVSLRKLTAVVDEVTDLHGDVWLVQHTEGRRVALGATGLDVSPAGTAAVSGSILEVAYRLKTSSGAFGLLEFTGLAGLGALIVAIVSLLQMRGLSSALRADMVTALNLGEAIKNGTGGASSVSRLRATSDTLLLLAQYAQEARHQSEVRSVGEDQAAASTASAKARGAAEWMSADEAIAVEELAPSTLSESGDGYHGSGGIHTLMPEHVFRACDIRGIADEEISEGNIPLFGQALGTVVQEQGWSKVLIARDSRITSPAFATALRTGLTVSGCDVVDLGAVPTPVMYFAMKALEISAAVMVTGSNNPPEYNGFKVQVGDEVLSGDALLAVRDKMAGDDLLRGAGEYEESDFADRYVTYITRDVALTRPLKVVVDAGNGIAGPIAVQLLEALECEVIPLFCEPDGSFPNRHPDPGNPDNLEALRLEVQAQQAEMGIALDGDGCCLGVVDGSGAVVSPDRILMLLAADVLIRHPGADVVYDVKGSRHLAGFVLSNGGRPIMWKSGHAHMRAKLFETGALLGGEYAGHYYIKERWYGFDDGIYAAARVMEILSGEMRPVKELFDEFPVSPATPEYNLPLEEGLSATMMHSIATKADFVDAQIVELDGLRVEFADGWGLVRASNSLPSLVFRFEADDAGALERIKESFRALLKSVDPALVAPF